MQWADYRERLGIGFNDESKFEALKNRFVNFGSSLSQLNFSEEDCCNFFILVGKKWDTIDDSSYQVSILFEECSSLKEIILNAVALHNSYNVECTNDSRGKFKANILKFLENSLKDLCIPYELISDKDGIFIFPKGVQEFDDNLVSKPLAWLKDFPKSEKAWMGALRSYSDNEDQPSLVADNFRKALETFFQEFFGSEKSLENMINEYCNYLKSNGVPTEISDDFRKNLESYYHFNNRYAKHHDNTSSKVLEYIMYATGNIIRLLITLKAF